MHRSQMHHDVRFRSRVRRIVEDGIAEKNDMHQSRLSAELGNEALEQGIRLAVAHDTYIQPDTGH